MGIRAPIGDSETLFVGSSCLCRFFGPLLTCLLLLKPSLPTNFCSLFFRADFASRVCIRIPSSAQSFFYLDFVFPPSIRPVPEHETDLQENCDLCQDWRAPKLLCFIVGVVMGLHIADLHSFWSCGAPLSCVFASS